MPSTSLACPDSLRRRQSATRAVFFIAGYGRASWAPLVPFVKAGIGLGDGQLGLLMLCLGGGSITAMPFAGGLVARFGCRRVIAAATLLLALSLMLLVALAGPGSLAAAALALAVFGMSAGVLDVAMNIEAIDVERAIGQPVMSGFHAFYSIGGIAGSAGASVLLTIGLSAGAAVACAAISMAVALALAVPALSTAAPPGPPSLFAVPRGVVWLLSGCTFIVFLAESAVLDWSGVLLTSSRAMPHAYAGYGYAAFAAAMSCGRLFGDRIVARLGGARVVTAGSLCAAAGFAIAALVPSWPIDLAAYALVGAGCANIAPVLFSSVGRQSRMPTGAAVAAMTTIGYAGVFVGPALIGAIARVTALAPAMLSLVALLAVVAACAAPVLRRG